MKIKTIQAFYTLINKEAGKVMLSGVHNHCHLLRYVSIEDRATAVRCFARMMV